MRVCIIFILATLSQYSYAQNTCSKLINLDTTINVLTDLEMGGESLFLSSLHFCQNDTNPNYFNQCSGISKFNTRGELIIYNLLDSITPEGQNRILLSNNVVLYAGHKVGEYTGRDTKLLALGTNLMVDSLFEFHSESGTVPNSEGIIEYKNALYLYGVKLNVNENKKYGHILKINKNTKVPEWDKLYARGKWKNDCFDLQPSIDEHLVFIQYFSDGSGAGGESGYRIVKIDTSGSILDSFEFTDLSIEYPRILASKEGDIYFSSQDLPYPHTIPSNGRINKISLNLDTLKWSLELPADPFHDAHRYKIYDYIQALNGDIIACGTVWDEGPDGPLGTPNNHTWNGFIVRVTQDGNLKWLREYRYLNLHPSLPTESFGEFRSSLLNKIYETTDSNFIAGGTVYYDAEQSAGLGFNENKSSIWLMEVSKDGCLADEECTETIIIDESDNLNPNFKIGTKWVYETEETPFPVKVGYQTFEIIDTTEWQEKKVFVVANSYDDTREYMFIENSKVYFWDASKSVFQLIYDFASTANYSIAWQGQCSSDTGTANITIDSISSLLINSKNISVQYISIQNSGTTEDPLSTEVYENIGLAHGGIKLPLGLGFCDSGRYLTKLRCFYSDTNYFTFVDYPCDSVWFTTSTLHLEDSNPIIYPNPSNGLMHTDHLDGNFKFELFNMEGMLLQTGSINNNEIVTAYKGLIIVRLYNRKSVFYSKIFLY